MVLDHVVVIGNPPDAPTLEPATARVARRAGQMPTAVTADRGCGESAVGEALCTLGVRDVVLPNKGKPSAKRREVETRPEFQELVKWRTGSESRISCLQAVGTW